MVYAVLSLYILFCVGDGVSRVEVGSNVSTVALRVVGDDEKGTQCLGI
jgi:hypothetical protein